MKKQLSTVRGPLPPGIKLDENVYVEMSDGIKLAVDLYRPEKDGKYPAILSMSPYIKEIQHQPPMLSHSIEAGNTGFFVPKGYVHVIAQIRGSGHSQGQYNLLDSREQEDGYDLVEWIAQQPWCNSNVGMMGDSYFAMSQYPVACLQPPHLKCIAPFDGLTDLYRDLIYPGGQMFTWFLGMWGVDTIRQCQWPGPVEGKLPPADFIAALDAHSEYGPYYSERSTLEKIDKIKVPVLNIVPQLGFVHSRGQLYGHPLINAPKKLLVLPPLGLHAHTFFIQNEAVNEQILRWFDYWLKGIDTGIMDDPEVAIFDNGTKEWRYENEYPLARTEWEKFYFRANPEGSASKPPYGLMSKEAPKNAEEPDKYITPACMPLVASGKPVLAYATPPLEEDLRVWGPLSVVLYGSSTTLDTTWFVKIGDVDPDGNTTPFTQGYLKASYREVDEVGSKPGQPFHLFQNPVRPEPHVIYEYQIEMMPIFHTFKSGHKIWVQIASDDFWFQTPLHTIYTSEMVPLPAANTIYHDPDHPSHLLLPVIPDAPILKPVRAPVSEIKPPQHG